MYIISIIQTIAVYFASSLGHTGLVIYYHWRNRAKSNNMCKAASFKRQQSFKNVVRLAAALV